MLSDLKRKVIQKIGLKIREMQEVVELFQVVPLIRGGTGKGTAKGIKTGNGKEIGNTTEIGIGKGSVTGGEKGTEKERGIGIGNVVGDERRGEMRSDDREEKRIKTMLMT